MSDKELLELIVSELNYVPNTMGTTMKTYDLISLIQKHLRKAK